MFELFKKARGVVPLLFVGVTAGAIHAHRTTGPKPSLSLAHQPRAQDQGPSPDPWRRELDLSRAKLEGRSLVQRLGDGSRVRFTVEPKLQRFATALLERYEIPYGSIVVTDVKTAKVRVLAGRSAANPALGVEETCLTPWAPAASIFKLITAAALLERGVPAATEVCYHGGLRGLRAGHLEDHPSRDQRCNTLTGAIAKSINPIMGKLALRYLDRKRQQQWADRFGFNRRLRFELPTRRSRAKIPKDRLERARVAAGFWHSELSPLHGALIAQTIAAGGEMKWPSVVEQVSLPGGRRIHPAPRSNGRVLSRATARQLGRMMRATTSARGTGRRGFIRRNGRPYLDIEVAGKTGSLSRKDPYLGYSWFVGFAPVERPAVAFAVLLGNPPKWRIKASTAARMVLGEYLRLRRQDTKERGKKKRDKAKARLALAATRAP